MRTFSGIMELSFSLAKAHFKLRNEGSYLGLFWYLLNPLALFAIILFVKQSAFPHIDIPQYPLYLLIGLALQNYLNRVVATSTEILTKNVGFIKSVRMPLEALVLSGVLNILFSHLFEIALIGCAMLYFGVPMLSAALYAAAFLLFTIFVTGLSFLFATIGVRVQDIGNIWTVFSQLLFFVTPIFYVLKEGTALHQLNMFNPMYYFITLARELPVFGILPSLHIVLVSAGLAAASLGIGLFAFGRSKARFAELL